MKKKDFSSLKNKTLVELTVMSMEISTQINKAQMELKMHKSKNTNIGKNLKKTLAQVLTLKREKELNTNN